MSGEDPIEAASACSEFLADPAKPVVGKTTSLWWLLAMPVVFPLLAIIECLPLTRTGWVILLLFLGPIAAVGAAVAVAVFF